MFYIVTLLLVSLFLLCISRIILLRIKIRTIEREIHDLEVYMAWISINLIGVKAR